MGANAEAEKRYLEVLREIDNYFDSDAYKEKFDKASFGLIPGMNEELLFENTERDAEDFLYLPENREELMEKIVEVFREIDKSSSPEEGGKK
jgi:hypothetical protein